MMTEKEKLLLLNITSFQHPFTTPKDLTEYNFDNKEFGIYTGFTIKLLN
jgi:hypothetical protein